MQPGFQVLYYICKLQINGIARYYVSGEENIHELEYVSNRVNSLCPILAQGSKWHTI